MKIYVTPYNSDSLCCLTILEITVIWQPLYSFYLYTYENSANLYSENFYLFVTKGRALFIIYVYDTNRL